MDRDSGQDFRKDLTDVQENGYGSEHGSEARRRLAGEGLSRERLTGGHSSERLAGARESRTSRERLTGKKEDRASEKRADGRTGTGETAKRPAEDADGKKQKNGTVKQKDSSQTIQAIGGILLSVFAAVGSFLAGIFFGIGQGLASLGAWVVSLPDVYRKYAAKRRRRRAAMKRKLTAEEYREYLKKERIRTALQAFLLAAAAVICAILLFFAIRGIGRGIRFLGGKIFSGRERAVETEQMTEAETEPARIYPEQTVAVGATGSMLLHSPFLTSYPDAEGNYDFGEIYRYITPYYSAPDFMTCEFEGTLAGKEAGYSGYPNFKSPDIIIENIRDSGVDLQMIASNHMYDAASDAFHRTMDVYAEKGILFGGARRAVSDKKYYIADLKGVQVGFIDYTYQTSGNGTNLNGIPVAEADAQLINSFDPDEMEKFYEEIGQNLEAMRREGARFLIVNLHWGIEYHLEESEEQRTIAQRLCDMGVDAVIGGHPHCEQPIDVLTSKDGTHSMFIIYSTGNALSNQRTYLMDSMPTGHTEDGVMVTLTLHQDTRGTVKITGVDILPTWVYRFPFNGSKYYVLPLKEDPDELRRLTEADLNALRSQGADINLEELYSDADASYKRTMEELGPGLAKAKQVFESKTEPAEEQTEEKTGSS